MSRRIGPLLLLACLAAPALADERATTDAGRVVLLRGDGTWAAVESAAAPGVPAPPKTAAEAVAVWDTTIENVEGEYGQKFIRFFLHYENRAARRVIGVQLEAVIRNAFGRPVHESTFEDEVSLAPASRERSTSFYKFEDNPFIAGEVYDRLWKGADDGTLKVEVMVLKVILEGGEVLSAGRGKAPRRK